MKKNIFAACVLAFAMLLTGCVSEPEKEFFAESNLEYELVENVIIEPEFSEYPPDTEKILVKITNNNDEDFVRETDYRLQKEENGEWRDVRSKKTIHDMLLCIVPANSTTGESPISLYGFPNPLPEGKYRVGIGTYDPPRYAWCEFTVKEPEGDDT